MNSRRTSPIELPEDIADLDRLNAGAVSILLARLHPRPRRSVPVADFHESLQGVIPALLEAGVLTSYDTDGVQKVRYEPRGYLVGSNELVEGDRVGVNKTRQALTYIIEEDGGRFFTRNNPDQGGAIWALNEELGVATGFELSVERDRFVTRRRRV